MRRHHRWLLHRVEPKRLRFWSENIQTGEDLTSANPSTAVQNYHRDPMAGSENSCSIIAFVAGTSNQTRTFVCLFGFFDDQLPAYPKSPVLFMGDGAPPCVDTVIYETV